MVLSRKQLIKAGVVFASSALLFLSNETEASANEYTSENWQPRTVEEIKSEISAQKENQDNDKSVIDYTFQWGDTLWGISEATDISVDKLVHVNDIDNRSLIHVGTTIYLSDDYSVLSVKNDDEIVSYDVSTDEVTETETPEEVTEAQEVEEQVEEVATETEVTETVEETEAVVETNQSEAASVPAESQSEASTESSEEGRWMTVEATAYSRNQEVLSNFTFTGIDLRDNPQVIAVDPNVIPLGSTIHVPGYGTFVAGDTGGAIKGNRIDLHMEDLQAAFQFGRRTIDIQVFE